MRRLLLTLPFFLFAGVPDAARGEGASPNVRAAAAVDEGAADHDLGDVEGPAPFLSVIGATADGLSGLRIAGKIENASVPAVFRLRVDNGCAHDTRLATTTRGIAFSVALRTDDLAEAFACAIDAEAGEASLSLITVTPDAEASSSSGLTLDPSIAVVAVDLDATSGHLVRFTVLADGPVASAHVTLGGTTYLATVAPIEEGSAEPASAFFDVPARAWAAAVLESASAVVEARLESGTNISIVLHPKARVETLEIDNDAG